MYICRSYCVSPSLYPPRAAPGPRRERGPARQAGTRHESVTGRGVAPADPRRCAVEPAGQPRPGGRARGWSGRRGVAGDRMSRSAFLLAAAARLHQPDIFRVGLVPVGSTPVAADLQLTRAAGCAAAARAGSSGGIRMAHAPTPPGPAAWPRLSIIRPRQSGPVIGGNRAIAARLGLDFYLQQRGGRVRLRG